VNKILGIVKFKKLPKPHLDYIRDPRQSLHVNKTTANYKLPETPHRPLGLCHQCKTH